MTIDWLGPPRLRPKGRARVAFYSCYFGQYEPFNPAALGPPNQAHDQYIFTDRDHLEGTKAQIVRLWDMGLEPAILSRLPKLCPHLFFQGYDWVVYLDNRASRRLGPAKIVSKAVADHPDMPAGRYFFRHGERDCCWDEVEACFALGYISRSQRDRILNLLELAQFPRNQGLFVNTCMVQKMGCAKTDQLNELWFQSLITHCQRDQVLLPYLLARSATPYRVLSANMQDWIWWPLFSGIERNAFQQAQITPK